MATDYGTGTRRDFIKKAAYVVPAVLSVNVALVTAASGSEPGMPNKGEDPGRGMRTGERMPRRSREQ
jgi:hypothetical protein